MSVKLSDYCKNNGISYITGYRWFKENKLPVPAYQTESGTILVEDEAPLAHDLQQHNDAISLFLKKTVEFSKNNSTIEDFAAYILSNFSIKINNTESSKQKLPAMEVQEPSKYVSINESMGQNGFLISDSLCEDQQIEMNSFVPARFDLPSNSVIDSLSNINFSSQVNDFAVPAQNGIGLTNSVFNNYLTTRNLSAKSLNLPLKAKRGRPKKKI